MTVDDLVKRKNELIDELMMEIEGCMRRFHEDTGATVRRIDVELMDTAPLVTERPRVRSVSAVHVEVEI